MPSEEIKIGILALQGAFKAHFNHLKQLNGVTPILIRYPDELKQCQGCVLPGGESTTQSIVGAYSQWKEALQAFNGLFFGTCAGLILIERLGLISAHIERNGFGPQKESFSAPVKLELPAQEEVEGIFIRAPRILSVDSQTRVIGTLESGEIVCVESKRALGCSFHPELSQSVSLHAYFIEKVSALELSPLPL